MPGGSSFDCDVFRFVHLEEIQPMDTSAAAVVVAALPSSSRRDSAPMDEHAPGRSFRVRIQRITSPHYLSMDAAFVKLPLPSAGDAPVPSGRTAKLTSREFEAELLHLQLFNDDSFFTLSASEAGVRYLLHSYCARVLHRTSVLCPSSGATAHCTFQARVLHG
jgi:hypothetical protein